MEGIVNEKIQQYEAELSGLTHFRCVVSVQFINGEGSITLSESGLFRKITETVCNTFCVTPAELFGNSRFENIKDARHTWRYVTKGLMPWLSLKQVAKMTGMCDHTTVINSYQKCRAYLKNEVSFREKYNTIITQLSTFKIKTLMNTDTAVTEINTLNEECQAIALWKVNNPNRASSELWTLKTKKFNENQARIEELRKALNSENGSGPTPADVEMLNEKY